MTVYVSVPGTTVPSMQVVAQTSVGTQERRKGTRKYLWFLAPLVILAGLSGWPQAGNVGPPPAVAAKTSVTPVSSVQQAVIKLPEKVTGDVGDFVTVTAVTDGKEVRWWSPDSGLALFPAQLLKDSKSTVVVGKKAGTYRLLAWTSVGGQPSDAAVTTVVIGLDPPPTPPDPPHPPDPDPKPKPPTPVAGLKVLIVYESGDLSKLPTAQLNILYSKVVRDWLDANTAMGSDGKTKEWRIYDKDTDLTAEAKHWQDAVKRTVSAPLPWYYLMDGSGTIIVYGPLPKDVASALALWGKYTPAKRKAV